MSIPVSTDFLMVMRADAAGKERIALVRCPSNLTFDGDLIVQGGLPMSAIPVVKTRVDVHAFSITIPAPARRSGHIDLTVPAGLSAFFNVVAYQSAVPGINKGALPDSREFDQMLITADIISDTLLRCSWVATGPVIGNFNFYYQIKN